MGTLSVATSGKANSGAAEMGPGNTHFGAANAAVMRACRAVFPQKTWLHVAAFLGISERAARHRMCGTREFTISELRALLQSESGLLVLSGLMADAKPKWWRGFLANIAAGDARRAIRNQHKKLQEAIDAVECLEGTLSRAEAALSVSDEDFMRPHVDAMREVSRPVHRTLARGRAK